MWLEGKIRFSDKLDLISFKSKWYVDLINYVVYKWLKFDKSAKWTIHFRVNRWNWPCNVR